MTVAWSEPAVADLSAIHDYIARDSPRYAQRFAERLIAAVFPQLGRVVPEGDGRHRELFVRPYRIIYRVDGKQVLIVTIVHGSRHLAGDDEKPGTGPEPPRSGAAVRLGADGRGANFGENQHRALWLPSGEALRTPSHCPY